MTIRPYQATDLDACMALFDSNMPPYFLLEERQPFMDWLAANASDGRYYVLEQNGQLLGCGGWYWDTERQQMGLSWGMIHQDWHSQGLGTQLTLHRLRAGWAAYPKEPFVLCTSQHTAPFYERLGFQTQTITPNGFGEGMHRYDMTAKLTPSVFPL